MIDPLIGEIMSHIQKSPGGCWVWIGDFRDGSARMYIASKRRYIKITRRLYENFYNRSISTGVKILHICKNSLCVNPKHIAWKVEDHTDDGLQNLLNLWAEKSSHVMELMK